MTSASFSFDNYSQGPNGPHPYGSTSTPAPTEYSAYNPQDLPGTHDSQTPSPPQSPLSTRTATNPLFLQFVDTLSQFNRLEEEQRTLLHQFAKLASVGEGLTQADFSTRAFHLAIVLADAAERRRITLEQKISNMTELLQDLQTRLEVTFAFTSEQKANIRGVCQSIVYEATRTAFMSMHIDVNKYLRLNKDILLLNNVFGIPAREKLLASMIKKTCSSVRNAFRQDIRASIEGATACSLSHFTFTSACKYMTGGPGEKLDQGFAIHNAVLRKFAFDHPGLLGGEEDENLDPSLPSELPELHGHKRKRHGGRIGKGQDFWSQVDKYFVLEIKRLGGRSLSGPKWKEHIDQITADDNMRFDNTIYGVGGTSSMGSGVSDAMRGIEGAAPRNPFSESAQYDLAGIFDNRS